MGNTHEWKFTEHRLANKHSMALWSTSPVIGKIQIKTAEKNIKYLAKKFHKSHEVFNSENYKILQLYLSFPKLLVLQSKGYLP